MTVRAAFKTAQNTFPGQGNRELPVSWDFTNVTVITDDLSPEMQQSEIESIQSVYIDNSINSSAVTLALLSNQSTQKIVAQPNTQGIYPIIASGRISYTATSAGGVIVPVIFSNTAKPYVVWGPLTADSATIGPFPSQGTYTDKSGSITAGGTSQLLAAANPNRRRIEIENPADATELLYFNFDAAADDTNTASFSLMAGGSYDSGAGPVSTQAINVNAATTGHKFIAKEM